MTRRRLVSLLGWTVVTPIAAIAALSFATATPKPCFVAGTHAYRIADSGHAAVTVRVDNTAQHPDLRMQFVDDPATADFVLVDDSGGASACRGIGTIKNIRLDAGTTNSAKAEKPDLTVALSQASAPYKIYVRSSHYTPQDAAALFAVMQQDAGGMEVAARN
ncbi:MAG: hypothetical protein P8Z80_02570 [Pseudolabrys sp.]|jgi:hypothetical protein